MLETSSSHAGSATWNTIRLDLRHAYDSDELERTLAHETAHVLAQRLSDRRISQHSSSMRVFDEGLAEQLAHALVPGPASAQARWIEAVLARERLHVQAKDLFDVETFRAQFGERLLYPMGFSWVHALSRACGPEVRVRILRALARPEGRKDLSGQILWQDTLQAIGCDLNRVALLWAELLKDKASELRKSVDATPQLSGGVSGTDEAEDTITLTAELQGPASDSCIIGMNTRGAESDAHGDYLSFSGEKQSDGSIRFSVERDLVSGEVLQFQFVETCLHEGVSYTFAPKWQRGRVPTDAH
jgi:hypothetical protein